MLQQILRDMWVDPEILAELDDAQKQTLFCKMREEQVRRWQAWDQEVSKDEIQRRDSQTEKKQVQFRKGEDGEPWVWVMGEHPDDPSIESILAEEVKKRALAQAREEAHQLRKSVEKELTHLIDYEPLGSLEQNFDLSPKNGDSLEDTLDLYSSVDELRQRIEELEPELKEKSDNEADKDYCEEHLKMNLKKKTLQFNFIEGKKEVIQEAARAGDGVSLRVAAWERRVAAARAGDILRGLRARRARAQRDARARAPEDDKLWREQERKAKEAEAAMREIARAAREAHRLAADTAPPGSSSGSPTGSPPASRPPNRKAVLEWFRGRERARSVGVDEHNRPVDWFHGLISRSEAERLLRAAAAGSFLVRVSERVWGYAVSYRGAHCRHYLVDASHGYRLLGAGQRVHDSLADLVNYHKRVPITEGGGELLTTPCVPAQTPVV